jgi:hypothetical protein
MFTGLRGVDGWEIKDLLEARDEMIRIAGFGGILFGVCEIPGVAWSFVLTGHLTPDRTFTGHRRSL